MPTKCYHCGRWAMYPRNHKRTCPKYIKPTLTERLMDKLEIAALLGESVEITEQELKLLTDVKEPI